MSILTCTGICPKNISIKDCPSKCPEAFLEKNKNPYCKDCKYEDICKSIWLKIYAHEDMNFKWEIWHCNGIFVLQLGINVKL